MATTFEGYCMKCRVKRNISGAPVTLANGRAAVQGKCPICQTKVTRMGTGVPKVTA